MAKINHALRKQVKELLEDEDDEIAFELLTADWHESSFYKTLTASQKESADTTISFILDFGYEYMHKTPDKWNNDDWDELILDIFPRKMSADLAFFEQIVPTLSDFILFHDRTTGYFASGKLKAYYILDLHKDCIERSQDSNIWGPAKSMLMENKDKKLSAIGSCLMAIPWLLFHLNY